jgi:hypothetical protein
MFRAEQGERLHLSGLDERQKHREIGIDRNHDLDGFGPGRRGNKQRGAENQGPDRSHNVLPATPPIL